MRQWLLKRFPADTAPLRMDGPQRGGSGELTWWQLMVILFAWPLAGVLAALLDHGHGLH